MLNLRDDLTAVGSNQSQLARHIGVSPAAVTQMIKYDLWPTTRGLSKALLKERITAYLSAKGLPAERLARTFDEAPAAPRANAELQAMAKANNSGPQPGSTQGEDPFMLLRHHSLSSAARQHFKVPRDPFINELNEDADVFITDDIRYVRAAMRHTARHGGMLAGSKRLATIHSLLTLAPDVPQVAEHAPAVFEDIDARAFLIVPKDGHFSDGVAEFARDGQNFHVKTPASHGLQWKNALGGFGAKPFKATLRVFNFGQDD